MNEDALIAAKSCPRKAAELDVRRFYLGTREFRPCACGTWIGKGDDETLWAVLERHQASPEHVAWRAAHED